jgi:hypothetical protein
MTDDDAEPGDIDLDGGDEGADQEPDGGDEDPCASINCDDNLACTGTETCVGGTCQPGTPETCSGHGDCQEPEASCSCHEGYAGIFCDRCDQGYHDEGGVCVPDDPLTAEVVLGEVTFDPLSNGGFDNAIHFRINALEDFEITEFEFSFVFRDSLDQQINSINVFNTWFYRGIVELISGTEVTMSWDNTQCTSAFITPEPFQSGNSQDYLMQIADSGVSSGDYLTTALTMVRLQDGRNISIQGVEITLPGAP